MGQIAMLFNIAANSQIDASSQAVTNLNGESSSLIFLLSLHYVKF